METKTLLFLLLLAACGGAYLAYYLYFSSKQANITTCAPYINATGCSSYVSAATNGLIDPSLAANDTTCAPYINATGCASYVSAATANLIDPSLAANDTTCAPYVATAVGNIIPASATGCATYIDAAVGQITPASATNCTPYINATGCASVCLAYTSLLFTVNCQGTAIQTFKLLDTSGNVIPLFLISQTNQDSKQSQLLSLVNNVTTGTGTSLPIFASSSVYGSFIVHTKVININTISSIVYQASSLAQVTSAGLSAPKYTTGSLTITINNVNQSGVGVTSPKQAVYTTTGTVALDLPPVTIPFNQYVSSLY